MNLTEALLRFGEALLAGFLGAYLTHSLQYRTFRKQEQYRDNQKKRDALRDLLGDIIPDMQLIMDGYLLLPEPPNERLLDRAHQRAPDLIKRTELAEALFLSNKEVHQALRDIRNTVTWTITPPSDPVYYDRESLIRDWYKKFEESVQVLGNELAILEKSLSSGWSWADNWRKLRVGLQSLLRW